MSELSTVQIGNVKFLGEVKVIGENSVEIRRPVTLHQRKNSINMQKVYLDEEEELLTIYNISGAFFLQAASRKSPIYHEYLRLTSSIHLANALPKEKN